MQESERRKLRHDILGSLNSVKLSVEVIKGSNDREEALMFLDCIAREVVKVEELIDNLVYDPSEQSTL